MSWFQLSEKRSKAGSLTAEQKHAVFKKACIPEHWANIFFKILDPMLSLWDCLSTDLRSVFEGASYIFD